MGKKLAVINLSILIILTLLVIPLASSCANTASTPAPASASTATVITSSSSTAAALATSDKPIEIKWVLRNTGWGSDPLFWEWVVFHEKFIPEVEKATNSRVKFIDLIGAVTEPTQYDGVVSGVGDIGANTILMTTGRFPRLEIMTQLDLFTTVYRPARVGAELYKKFPSIQQEFSDVKILCAYAATPSPPGIGMATASKPVYTLADAKGMKIGNYGLWGTKLTEALGFTAVAVPPFNAFESLQRGVIDGSFLDALMLDYLKIGEVVDYWHPISAQLSPFWFAMNWNTWNNLPPDIQKVFEDVAQNVPDWVDEALQVEVPQSLAKYPEIKTIEIAPEEQTKWLAAQDPVQAEYLTELQKQGITDGQEIYDEFSRLLKEYANKKQ